MKSTILLISILCNIFFASKIIDLENFRYSVVVGMCGDYKNELDKTKWLECNKSQKTRTHQLWNLYYGLSN